MNMGYDSSVGQAGSKLGLTTGMNMRKEHPGRLDLLFIIEPLDMHMRSPVCIRKIGSLPAEGSISSHPM